jgi:hypothetical protein
MDICWQLSRYELQKSNSFSTLSPGEESWVHHFEPENKRQSMEFRHKCLPAPKTFKTAPSGSKIMLTVFWVVSGVVDPKFLPTGATINSECYVGPLQKFKAGIRRVHPDMWLVFSDTTMRDLTRSHEWLKRFTALVPLSWTTQHKPRLGSIWRPFLPEIEGTCERTSHLVRRWSQDSGAGVVTLTRRPVLSRRTPETTRTLAEVCGPQ